MRKTILDLVYQYAKSNNRIVFIGSDLGSGVLDEMKKNIPDRFFMEGVSEQHIIGMAAGLALNGFIPYVNTIATFLTRRCYEQIALDLCLQDLPVRLIASGGGGVYAPLGPTHLAVEDLAIMRMLPNMTVVAPCDAQEMGRLMAVSVEWPHPMYIRLAKGGDNIVSVQEHGFQIGKGILMVKPKAGLFITTGVMTQVALKAIDELSKDGVHCGLLHLHTVKPLDHEALLNLLPRVSAVVTVEEHSRIGGLGSAVLEFCCDELPEHVSKLTRIGISDRFAEQYGTQDTLLAYWGLTVEALCKAMKTKMKEK
jgi:transketolase